MIIKGKFKGRGLKKAIFIVFGIIILFFATCAGLILYGNLYRPASAASKVNFTSDYFFTYKTGVYDKDGNLFNIKGVNAGNLFLQEGWLSPFSSGPSLDENGNYEKDGDGNILYPTFTQDDLLNGLNENPNCGEENIDEWLDYYYNSWWQEQDFKNVKEKNLNTIRLPFYWKNILNDDLTLKEKSVSFKYLDWFIEGAKNNNLYIILDLHGAPGSQNGNEHSGNNESGVNLYSTESYMDAVVTIWDYVSDYYLNDRADLAPTILAYDLLNEPSTVTNGATSKACWDLFDRCYDAIRGNNDNHIISMMGCWDYSGLPDPKTYNWDNVLYQYHYYNWYHDNISYPLFWTYFQLFNIGRQYEVATFIGEFTFFTDQDAWVNGLNYFDSMGYGWTAWTYKGTVTGYWDTSWAFYTCKLHLDVQSEELKLDVRTCTFDEWKETCDKTVTSNCESGVMDKSVKKYFEK